MKSFLYGACALLISTAALLGPAHAATSCYGGVTLGQTIAQSDLSLDAVGGPAGLVTVDSIGADGMSGGITGGCDWRTGAWVVGAWGDYSWHSADFEVGAFGAPGDLIEWDLEDQWSVGGRLGFMATERTLIYGLIGWTRARYSDISSPALGASFDIDDRDGVVYGGGIEVELVENIVVGAEYRYSDLEDVDVAILPGAANLNIDSGLHTARAVLKYRFDVAAP
ncbi:Outer membrane protein beta-barrel domain-containing protein [Filomicrobium insigne]|uniref:Outer membrane protein beta-barrel domain-containing protein n=1 Tax=Filomicrobium insigne TaxID=418854 RepID=A0A1H0SCF7_9HYPH|nr:outer membrane beta-barrel protein [Filomicrobium insigne]SDP39444.1 Outer membrane protein beta-barrel domain-containing protein [Filomicrobium insigne]